MSSSFDCCDPVFCLIELAREQPDLPLYTFLDSRLRISARLSAAETLRKARRMAAAIQQHAQPGEAVMLLFPHGPDFIVALLAAQLADCIPVPVSFHRRLGMIDTTALIAGTGLRTVVGPATVLARYQASRRHHGTEPGGTAMCYVDVDAVVERDFHADTSTQHNISFIYPCAVAGDAVCPMALSQRNVQTSLNAVRQQLGPGADDRLLACLDLADGAALLMHVLLPLQVGARSYFLSMDDFIEAPSLWLRAASSWHCTIINAPAAGLTLCAQGVAENEEAGLDLGCVRRLCLGGEQLAPCLVEQFMERYGCYGLSRGALFSCFGMSSVGAWVSGRNGFHARQIGGVSYLNQGCLLPDVQWRLDASKIAQATGNDLHSQHREYLPGGELLLTSAATGVICAFSAAARDQSPAQYLRSLFSTPNADAGMMINTGEQAAIIAGELFCHGRTAHRFCFAGKEYQAEDVEAAVMQAFGMRGLSRCVVLTGEGTREIVLLAECARPQRADRWQGAVTEIIRSVKKTTGLLLDRVLLLRPGSLHIGVNGTVLRGRCQEALHDGSLMLRLLPVRGK